ncbi:MAG: FeoA family protein [Acidimicrobiia bacterium]
MLRRRTSGTPTATGRRTLEKTRRDETVRVVRVSGRPVLIRRLAALGLVPGAQLTVMKPASPLIVSLGGARIAIGRTAASSVEVEVG